MGLEAEDVVLTLLTLVALPTYGLDFNVEGVLAAAVGYSFLTSSSSGV